VVSSGCAGTLSSHPPTMACHALPFYAKFC
jgi:hypothetical protein